MYLQDNRILSCTNVSLHLSASYFNSYFVFRFVVYINGLVSVMFIISLIHGGWILLTCQLAKIRMAMIDIIALVRMFLFIIMPQYYWKGGRYVVRVNYS